MIPKMRTTNMITGTIKRGNLNLVCPNSGLSMNSIAKTQSESLGHMSTSKDYETSFPEPTIEGGSILHDPRVPAREQFLQITFLFGLGKLYLLAQGFLVGFSPVQLPDDAHWRGKGRIGHLGK